MRNLVFCLIAILMSFCFTTLDAVSSTGLTVNEFMAKNTMTIVDESSEYEDWIEIYNGGPSDVSLSGMYLTDKADDLIQWQFPFGGVMLETGGFLLVWCDEDLDQGPLHADFKLSTDGEFIALVDTDGVTIIDSLPFGSQTSDISYGRYPDGADSWQFFDQATPGSANTGSSNLPPVITGTAYSPGQPHSTDTVTVRSQVTDDSGVEAVTLHYDAGSGYVELVMEDDGTHGDGEAGDDVYGAFVPPQANGTTVSYYISAVDVSEAVTTDPTDAPATTYSYQVGYIAPALFINEFMADNDSIVQDEAGDYDDWFELYNAGDTDVNLGGMYLTDKLADHTQWQIPDTTIASHGFLLFWADKEAGEGPLHANFNLSKSGEALVFLDTDGMTIIDSVVFGVQTLNVSYGRYPDGTDSWQFFDQATPGSANMMFAKGDVNADGSINVLDVLAVVNHILGTVPLSDEAIPRADCNGDSSINILDALGIVNVILGIGECGS